MAGESAAGPSRTPSRVSHRDSPLGSRRGTPSTSPPVHLSLLRDFLGQTVRLTGLSTSMLPTPSDYSLSEFSEGEAFIIPLLCRTLEAIGATNERLDLLTATVENLEITASTQSAQLPPQPPQDFAPIAALEASVRDLSSRFAASATRPPPPAPPAQPQPRRQPPPPLPPLAQPLHQPPGGEYPATFDPDIPRYCTENSKWYGNPSAFAVKFPRSWEAQKYHNGGHPDNSDFTPGHLEPGYRPAPPTYAAAATSEPPKGKGKGKAKGKNPATPAEVAASSATAPRSKGPSPLPAAERRFFAPRLFPLEHEDLVRMAATAPDIMAKVLQDANCPYPFLFTATVNSKGAVSLLCTDLHTPATAYSPYYEAMANKLNQAFPMGDNPYRPFRPAPNQVDLTIHRLPRSYMPPDQEDLLPALSLSISNAVGVKIFAARSLQPDPVKRAEQPTTLVVVAVAPADVPKFGNSISLFSRSRRVEKANSSSRSSQCGNCNRFSHSSPACKASQIGRAH